MISLNGWLVVKAQNLETLMGCRKQKVAGRKRQEKMNSVQEEFRNRAKFHRLRKFAILEISTLHPKLMPSAIPAKQRTSKIIRIQK